MPSSAKTRIVIYFIVFALCCMIFGGGYYLGYVQSVNFQKAQADEERQVRIMQFAQEHANEINAIQDHVPTDTWKEFRSQWYGFVIKHPADWVVRTISPTADKKAAVYRIGFYKPQVDNGKQEGYEVAVYDLKRTSELAFTDEFPSVTDQSRKDQGQCETISGHLYETGDYPAEEIYIPEGDDCYSPTLFYSNVTGQYIYTISPIIVEEHVTADPMVATTDRVPEMFAAASQFTNIDIVRPKPKPVAPKVNAPMPATYTRDALGRLVCEKKNDKPSKSKENNKGKMHLDMECCLDPDEYPNPHCYYDPGKYGKYLNR